MAGFCLFEHHSRTKAIRGKKKNAIRQLYAHYTRAAFKSTNFDKTTIRGSIGATKKHLVFKPLSRTEKPTSPSATGQLPLGPSATGQLFRTHLLYANYTPLHAPERRPRTHGIHGTHETHGSHGSHGSAARVHGPAYSSRIVPARIRLQTGPNNSKFGARPPPYLF